MRSVSSAHLIAYTAGLLILAGPASAATWVVSPDGVGDYPTIQAAIDAADDGDVIELADGTFVGTGNRDVDMRGKSVTVISQSRDPILCVIDCEGTQADRHGGFVFRSGESAGSRLESIGIIRGSGSGGGILCENGSSPTLVDCVITDCRTNGGHGASLYCTNRSSPNVIGCTFRGSTAYWGGAVSIRWDCAPVFTECLFEDNLAWRGGAVRGQEALRLTFIDCVFRNNESTDSGGAISAGDNSNPGVIRTSVVMTGCRIIENSARSSGGGVRFSYATLELDDCMFIGNEASKGGAVSTWDSEVFLDGVIFAGNEAGRGAALDASVSTVEALGCTWYGNSSSHDVGVIRSLHDTSLTIRSSIVSHSVGARGISCESGGSATLSCSNLYANEGGDWVDCVAGLDGVDGNFSGDPLFCTPESYDFTVRGDSPCLPGNHPDGVACGIIGALGEGCSRPTPTVSTSWGQVKLRYGSTLTK